MKPDSKGCSMLLRIASNNQEHPASYCYWAIQPGFIEFRDGGAVVMRLDAVLENAPTLVAEDAGCSDVYGRCAEVLVSSDMTRSLLGCISSSYGILISAAVWADRMDEFRVEWANRQLPSTSAKERASDMMNVVMEVGKTRGRRLADCCIESGKVREIGIQTCQWADDTSGDYDHLCLRWEDAVNIGYEGEVPGTAFESTRGTL